MKTLCKVLTLLAVAATLSIPLTASAQEVNFGALKQKDKNIIHLKTGAESGIVASAGYSRILPLGDRPLILSGEATVPWAEFDVKDYKLRFGAMLPIVGKHEWKLIGRIVPTLRGLSNDSARLTGIATDFGLLGGYYGKHWFAAAEAGFDWNIATHIKHSEAYRRYRYQDAKNGWYSAPGGNLHAGLLGGYSFSRYDLVMRAGQRRHTNGDITLLPAYFTLGFNAHW